jgi:hypothetical protein
MSIKQDQTLHPEPKFANEGKNNLQPKRVNYQSDGRTLEVEFYRGQDYIGRVRLQDALDSESIDVYFPDWKEHITNQNREVLSEQAFNFASEALTARVSSWADFHQPSAGVKHLHTFSGSANGQIHQLTLI